MTPDLPLPEDEAARLRTLHELRILDTQAEPVFAAIGRTACAHSGWPIGGLGLVDARRQWLLAVEGLDVPEIPRELAFCAHAILDDGGLEIADLRDDPRFADNALVRGDSGLRAYVGFPVVVDGHRIGTVFTAHAQPQRLVPAQLAALRDLASLAGALLEARLNAQRARLQEARVRGASRAGSDWLWESDADGLLTWVSESVEAHTGRPASDEIGRPSRELNLPPPDEHRASWDAYLAARARREPFDHTVALRHTARGPITVSFSGRPVFDSQGRFKGYRGAARNITDELAQRSETQRMLLLLREAIERVAAGVMVSDADGRIVLHNAEWRTGIARFVAAPPARWDDLVRAMVAAGAYPDAAGREAEFVEWRLGLASAAGQQHALRLGERHMLVTDQRLADGSVIHLSIDITHRRTAELALADRQARLGALLRSLPDLWFVVDREGRYLECSDEHHPWLIKPFAQMRGRRFAELVSGRLAERGRLGEQAVRDALASGEVQRIEYELTTADGVRRRFEARISPISADTALYLTRDLTELRKLTRDVELMQRALEAEAALPMVVADAQQADMPLIYVNAAFERLSGRPRAEVLGRNCRFLQGDERDQPELARLRTALAAGLPCNVTLNNQRANGEVFINEVHVAPVHDADGRLTHFIGVQHDITERGRAARQLELSEVLYRSVTSTISDGLLVVAPTGHVVTANPAAAAVLARSGPQLEGQRLGQLGYQLLHEDGRTVDLIDHPVRAVLRDGARVLDRVYGLRRPDGVLLVLRLSAQPLRLTPDDRELSCVVTFRDIGAQRRAEQALAQAELRWKFALEDAGDGVWDYDEDTQAVFFSPRWKQMLGYRDDEIGADLREWSRRVHPDDYPGVRDAIRRYRNGESTEYRTEHRLRHKEGRWVWVFDRAKIVERRADGSPRRVVGIHTDITRLKAAEQALGDQRAAELASQAKSEFLSRMSHEMRTPLNAVIGFAQLLRLRGESDPAQVRPFSEHILQAGQHLLALVNDVLDLQRVETGSFALELVPVPLRDAVEAALELVRPAAQARGIALGADIDTGLVVRADPQRLRQVLLNLLSNGVKYNRPRGTLRCRVEPTRAGRCALLIEDSGPGLTAAQVERLFQPFERLGLETSGIEGTGLGLIIARHLAEQMEGSLRLSSEPGVGTQVRLEMPLASAPQPTALAGAAPATGPAAVTARPLRLLYVEDNHLNALLFEEAIKLRDGLALKIAEDGEMALALARDWQPEVLVLDAHLPGTTGYELLRQLRELPALTAVPAFMCSADAMPEDLQRAREAGFAGYWTKPIDIARVIEELDALRPDPA